VGSVHAPSVASPVIARIRIASRTSVAAAATSLAGASTRRAFAIRACVILSLSQVGRRSELHVGARERLTLVRGDPMAASSQADREH